MSREKKAPAEHNLDAWYQETVTKLYRFTYALLQNREEAEDITQEAYVRCLKKNTKEFPAYPYLKQVARNLIYDRYRHRQIAYRQLDELSLREDVLAGEENWVTRALIVVGYDPR